MNYSRLGRTGLDCSRLGFGTWQIGGGRWKGVSAEESVALLRYAAECGINTFDAAMVYGQYRGDSTERRSRSLELLGQAFGGERRKDIVICLKLGQLDEYSHRAFYQPRNVVEELRRALSALRTDYVDICLVHAPSLAEVRDGRALATLQTIQALGIARFVGYSFEAEPEHARLAVAQEIDVMMLQYNLIDTECGDVFARAADVGVGILVGGPFKRGYLTGTYETVGDLPTDDDYWNWNVRYSKDKVRAVLARACELKREAGGAGQLRLHALRHVLERPGAASAIVGHRSTLEVDDNVLAIQAV